MDANKKELTHLNSKGDAHMVDVGAKPATMRIAKASGFIEMKESTLAMITNEEAPKGDVFATARIAGIMAAKRTSDLIPLCHPLSLSAATLDLTSSKEPCGICIEAEVKTSGATGVEMEALTMVSVAGLTIYDMCKAVDRSMVINEIALEYKSGGKSGIYKRETK